MMTREPTMCRLFRWTRRRSPSEYVAGLACEKQSVTTRRFFFGLLFASVILACFAGWLVATSSPRITRAPFERVKKGMSRQEAIRILGTPRKSVILSDELHCDFWV